DSSETSFSHDRPPPPTSTWPSRATPLLSRAASPDGWGDESGSIRRSSPRPSSCPEDGGSTSPRRAASDTRAPGRSPRSRRRPSERISGDVISPSTPWRSACDRGRGRSSSTRPAAWWRRLGLPARSAAALIRARVEAPAMRDRMTRAADPGAAYESLRGTPELTLAWALVGAASGRPQRYLAAHLATWRHVRPLLGGDDLRALGLKPGPRFG